VLSDLESSTGATLLTTEVNPRARLIRVTVVGDAAQARLQAAALPLLAAQRIGDARLEFRRAGDAQLQDLGRRGDLRDQRLAALAQELQQMQVRLDSLSAASTPRAQVLLRELQAWLPQVQALSLTDLPTGAREVRVQLPPALHAPSAQHLRAWLAARLGDAELTLIHEVGHRPAKP